MKQLIELAERYDVYLIEDDYLAGFVHDNSHLPLHYHDSYQRVIYLKSFSKIVFPGIRIEAVVLPEKLHK